jgi:hypothetical protein
MLAWKADDIVVGKVSSCSRLPLPFKTLVTLAAALSLGLALSSGAFARSFGVEMAAPPELKTILEKNLQIYVRSPILG